MGTNTAGAAAGPLTLSARYELARAQGTTPNGWRELARGFNRQADTAWSLTERRRFRALATTCQVQADRQSQRPCLTVPTGKFAGRSGRAVAA